MQIKRDAQGLGGRPELSVHRIVVIDDRVGVADLREAVDDRALEAELLDRARQLGARRFGVLHGQRRKTGEAIGMPRHAGGQCVVAPPRDVDSARAIECRLHAGRVERQERERDAVRVHFAHALAPQI